MQRFNWCRHAVLMTTGMGLLVMLASSPALAVTRSMVGSLGVIQPSVAPPFFFEQGPAVLGKKMGPYPPTRGWTSVDFAGSTVSTFVGRDVTIPANRLDFSGARIRDFSAFPTFGNETKTFMVSQQAVTFREGQGALAACPGPGCTSSGNGTAISWCPPLAEPGSIAAPGTVGNPVGDWDCGSWPAGAGGGNRFQRIAISNSSGRNKFGGTFSLLRNLRANVWRILVQPGTDGIAEVSRTFRNFQDLAWSGGRPAFQYLTDPGNPGPRLFARLNSNGAVTATFGCVNPTGTPGGTFMLGSPVAGVGSNCGTPTAEAVPVQAWGFPMTTGDIEGSDPFPFGLVITSVAPPGTPLSPNVGTQPASAGFFFTRMGTDRVTTPGRSRNLVLVGGGVAVDPESGNSFFRLTDLRLKILVPEPAMGFGLVAGASALMALARRRWR